MGTGARRSRRDRCRTSVRGFVRPDAADEHAAPEPHETGERKCEQRRPQTFPAVRRLAIVHLVSPSQLFERRVKVTASDFHVSDEIRVTATRQVRDKTVTRALSHQLTAIRRLTAEI
jgi:hypothetical protein